MGSQNVYNEGPELYELLMEAELQQYYNALRTNIKVQSVAQLKYVSNSDLSLIGMSKLEISRLIKYFHKYHPQTYLDKIKKKLLRHKEHSTSVKSFASQNPALTCGLPSSPSRHIIPADAITILKELGCGEYGTVRHGVWTADSGERIQVAIKCLSQERMENSPMEFLKEAAIMHSVDHDHIVRLYGVVLDIDTSSLMLITELAPLRSLLEFVKEQSVRPNVSVPTLFDFAVQICDGMQYLESKRLIHRDLAARNILVFSKSKIKISDFGLSRALGVGKDYYQTNFNVNLKLPIAWCAPECINFLRFTSSSDVWAYGVTLWEMFSYGFQPWPALTGQQILDAIDEPNYLRLEKPECCPNEIYYQVMLKCWEHEPLQRPNFTQLAHLLQECEPEQVQAIRNSEVKSRRDMLEYEAGDMIVVLDKNTRKQLVGHDDVFWKGVLKCGRSGLFNPANSISLGQSNKKNKIWHKTAGRREMIGIQPKDHRFDRSIDCGTIGNAFGDHLFHGSTFRVPKQVVAPYKPEQCASNFSGSESPCTRLFRPNSTGSEIISSDTAPLLCQESQINSESLSHTLKKRPSPLYVHSTDTNHEYHEISCEENETKVTEDVKTLNLTCEISGSVNPTFRQIPPLQHPIDASALEKKFDPLVDEVFQSLQDDLQSDNAHNMKNELREMASQSRKLHTVKPISSSDGRTLEQAIAKAHELASKCMLDSNSSGRPSHKFESTDDTSSPTYSGYRRKFSFLLGAERNPERERRNFSQEAASIPNIQATFTDQAKEAYNSLIERSPQEILVPVPVCGDGLKTDYLIKGAAGDTTGFHWSPQFCCNDTVNFIDDTTNIEPIHEYEEYEGEPYLSKVNELGNVLPLPPRNRSPSKIVSTRHHRKHELFTSEEKNQSNIIRRSSSSEGVPLPPPPKPFKQNINEEHKCIGDCDCSSNEIINTPSIPNEASSIKITAADNSSFIVNRLTNSLSDSLNGNNSLSNRFLDNCDALSDESENLHLIQTARNNVSMDAVAVSRFEWGREATNLSNYDLGLTKAQTNRTNFNRNDLGQHEHNRAYDFCQTLANTPSMSITDSGDYANPESITSDGTGTGTTLYIRPTHV